MLDTIKKFAASLLIIGSIMFLSLLTPQIHNQYLRYEVGESVVQVLSPDGRGGGTGFAIKADSGQEYIMTNKHVCEAAHNGWLKIKNGNIDVFKKVIYKDNIHDLCLIQGDKRLSPLDLGSNLYKGQSMYIVGHPGLRQLTVSHGEYIGYHEIQLIDSSVKLKKQCKGEIYDLSPMEQWLFGMEWICIRSYMSYATSAIAYGGNSGSPVVNKYGNVVGVLFAGNPRQNTDNYVVPLKEVKRVLAKF